MGKDRGAAKHRQAERSGTVLGKRLGALEENGTDYRYYTFSWKERLRMILQYLLLSGGFAYLFYRSWIVLALLWGFYPVYRSAEKRSAFKNVRSFCAGSLKTVSNALLLLWRRAIRLKTRSGKLMRRCGCSMGSRR